MMRLSEFGSASLCILLLLAGCSEGSEGAQVGDPSFELESVGGGDYNDPWGKHAADLNGDGHMDLLVANRGSEDVHVYYGPNWRRQVVLSGQLFATDLDVADIDRDGQNDIVAIADDQLFWYAAPDWQPQLIAEIEFHDIEVIDLNGDGLLDVVGRDQSYFGDTGDSLHVLWQDDPHSWRGDRLGVEHGEGLLVVDLNDDGLVDIATAQTWFQNRGEERWRRHSLSRSFDYPHVSIAAGDIDLDGATDIVLAPAEPESEVYRVSWLRNPGAPGDRWEEHTIADELETVLHTASIGDADLDGDLDVLVAAMHQGADPDLVTIYLNGGHGERWRPVVVSEYGSHNARFVDADDDGDLDVFGANFSGEDQEVNLWKNQLCEDDSQQWQRHVIDPERPGQQAPFVGAGDLNADGLPDIVTGGYWYPNPGAADFSWDRRSLSDDAELDFVTLSDIDGDSRLEVLALTVTSSPEFVWLDATDDDGLEVIPTGIAASADFLQGAATLVESQDAARSVVLSWHEEGHGIEVVRPSEDGAGWSLIQLADYSQDEALSVGDIDGDGDEDILTGTRWLENRGGGFAVMPIDDTDELPDRNRLADMDGDGDLDAVVGFQAISVPGDIVWYESESPRERQWAEHVVGSIVGPMSLSVADLDGDGDLDIVAGEHNLDEPEDAALWLFTNTSGDGRRWQRDLIHRGDEHHDGAELIDIDGDGDLDVLSIGWGHGRVLLYENRNPRCP